MKNILILIFSIVFLSSCDRNCVLTETLPVETGSSFVLYVDSQCSAVLPDLRSYIHASDNCVGTVTKYQSPVPGTILTVGGAPVIITFTAMDASGNISNPVYVPLLLLDTIKPVLVLDPSILTNNWDALDKLYDTADRFLVDLLHFDTVIPEDHYSVPQQVGTSYFYGINRRTYPVLNWQYGGGKWTSSWDGVAMMDSAVYKDKKLVITVPPGHAYNGIGKRMFAFE